MLKRTLAWLLSLLLLVATPAAFAASYHLDPTTGLYVDQYGKVIEELWDEAAGLYILKGVGIKIEHVEEEPEDKGEGEGEGIVVGPEDEHFTETETQTESQHLTQEEWEARMAKAIRQNGEIGNTVYLTGTGESFPVQIEYLGLGRSSVILNGEHLLVPTSSLKWETEAPPEKVLAVVSTTKQTYATMRAKKSQKAFVMGHCEKCSVLRVVSTGKTWTKVESNGMCGFVLTSTLTFYDNEPKEYVTGMVSYKGNINSRNTVHVRTSTKSSARQLAEFDCGTPLTIFSQDEKWCEVDVGGWHCYILTEFVTLDSAFSAMN